MIIGIAGKKRSGKDTVAKLLNLCFIHERYSKSNKFKDKIKKEYERLNTIDDSKSIKDYNNIIHFADNIKTIVAIICNVSFEFINSDECKDTNIPNYINCPLGRTYRHLFQYLGTEIGRKMLGEDIWVKSTINKAQYMDGIYEVCIIGDIRFNNEAEAIYNEVPEKPIDNDPDWCIYTTKGYIIKVVSNRTSNEDTHESEEVNVPHDSILYNNGTIDELIDEVIKEYNIIKAKYFNNDK